MPLSGTPAISPRPLPSPGPKVTESVELLDRYCARFDERAAFLQNASKHIHEVIIPAMEKLVNDFGKHSAFFTIDRTPQHTLNPIATLILRNEPINGIRMLHARAVYSPSPREDQLQLTVDTEGRNISLRSRPMPQLTFDCVYDELSALILTNLKRQTTTAAEE